MTDQYAVIGNPIAQSKSPSIHKIFAHANVQDMDYGTILGMVGQFESQVDAWINNGGRGLNITAPFKLDAFNYANELSHAAQLAGAVNAFKIVDGVTVAENFDGIGLVNDLTTNLKCMLRGMHVLILGSGGATRGALLPIVNADPAKLTIAHRDLKRSHELIESFRSMGRIEHLEYPQLSGRSFDVILNATSSSLFGQLPPINSAIFANCQLAYDLSYGKGLTPFLALAKAARVPELADGVGMLVEQAACAFEWWRGVRPDTRAAIASIAVPLV